MYKSLVEIKCECQARRGWALLWQTNLAADTDTGMGRQTTDKLVRIKVVLAIIIALFVFFFWSAARGGVIGIVFAPRWRIVTMIEVKGGRKERT